MFVDCTFSCIPKGFKQLLIVMIYTAATGNKVRYLKIYLERVSKNLQLIFMLIVRTGMYVPIYYVLLQNKSESTYEYAIQACVSASDGKMQATTYISDFEQAIMTTMKTEFPGAVAVGCLFHWQQAIKMKLGEFHIPKALIRLLIGSDGVMNILTVIPVEEIIPKGIPYCRCGFDESSHKGQFGAFWDYFVKTWK